MNTEKKNSPDELVARFTRRKVEEIVCKTLDGYKAAMFGYDTLSADELVAIGVSLFMNITVVPLEKMTQHPAKMRRALIWELQKAIKGGSNRGMTEVEDEGR